MKKTQQMPEDSPHGMKKNFFNLYKGRVIKFSQYWLALTKSGLRFYYTVYFLFPKNIRKII